MDHYTISIPKIKQHIFRSFPIFPKPPTNESGDSTIQLGLRDAKGQPKAQNFNKSSDRNSNTMT